MTFAAILVKCPGRLPRRSFAKAGVTTQRVANAVFFDIFVNVGDEVTSL